MKGKDLINKIVRVDMPDTEQVRENCHRQTAKQKRQEKRLFRRTAFAAATAAVLVMCLVFGSVLFNPQDGGVMNAFTIRAYAMELQADGTIIKHEIDLLDQTGTWGGFYDGEYMYINISLEVEGENIESVKFSLENGFFAKQNYNPHEVQSVTTRRLYVGDADGNLVPTVFGAEFERLGNQIALTDMQADNVLLFVAASANQYTMPENIEIQVHVLFYDGEQQTRTFTLNFENRLGVIAGDFPAFELEPLDFNSIDLNDLTLIPESISVLTPYADTHNVWGGEDMYVWVHENGSSTFVRRSDFEEARINIRGMARIGNDVILAVVKLQDGELVGMEYVVPPQIASDFGF